MNYGPCTVCVLKPAIDFARRCEEHRRCDGCGTREGLVYRIDSLYCDPCYEQHIQAQIDVFDEETEMRGIVICPWCGYRFADSFEYASWYDEETMCDRCGRRLCIDAVVDVTYTTTRAGENEAVEGFYRAVSHSNSLRGSVK